MNVGRGQMECDGAETTFRLSAKRTSPFKSAGASVQSTAGSRGVRISGSNAGYTMFRGSVKGTGYLLHSQFPLHFPSRASPCAITFQLESSYLRFGTIYWSHLQGSNSPRLFLDRLIVYAPIVTGFINGEPYVQTLHLMANLTCRPYT